MDIKEIRLKRETLEFQIGEMIHNFEQETDVEVAPTLKYDRWYAADNDEETPITPRVVFDIEIGYHYDEDDSDAEDLPEQTQAATA